MVRINILLILFVADVIFVAALLVRAWYRSCERRFSALVEAEQQPSRLT